MAHVWMRELARSVSRGKTSGIVWSTRIAFVAATIVAAIDDSDNL
jgi:hypothetical protein